MNIPTIVKQTVKKIMMKVVLLNQNLPSLPLLTK